MRMLPILLMIVFAGCCNFVLAQNRQLHFYEYRHGIALVRVGKLPALGEEDKGVGLKCKYGIADIHGKLLADTVYDYISLVDESGMAVMVKGNKVGVMDSTGRMVSPFVYRTEPLLWKYPQYYNGMLPVLSRRNGGDKWHNRSRVGFIDRKGKLVIDTVYDLLNATHLDSPMAGVPYFQYKLKGDFYEFSGDRCLVTKGGRNFVIDKNGRELYQVSRYVKYGLNLHGYLIVDSSQEYGWDPNRPESDKVVSTSAYFNKSGKAIVPPAGTDIVFIWKEHVVVKTQDKGEYRLVDPANGNFESGTSYTRISARVDGGLDTDKGVLEN